MNQIVWRKASIDWSDRVLHQTALEADQASDGHPLLAGKDGPLRDGFRARSDGNRMRAGHTCVTGESCEDVACAVSTDLGWGIRA